LCVVWNVLWCFIWKVLSRNCPAYGNVEWQVWSDYPSHRTVECERNSSDRNKLSKGVDEMHPRTEHRKSWAKLDWSEVSSGGQEEWQSDHSWDWLLGWKKWEKIRISHNSNTAFICWGSASRTTWPCSRMNCGTGSNNYDLLCPVKKGLHIGQLFCCKWKGCFEKHWKSRTLKGVKPREEEEQEKGSESVRRIYGNIAQPNKQNPKERLMLRFTLCPQKQMGCNTLGFLKWKESQNHSAKWYIPKLAYLK
jgi:hypothetical protein